MLGDSAYRGIVWFTVWQAALSTALTLVLGLPLAYVLARYRFAGRSIARAFVTVPFVLPTVVVGSAFLALGVRPSVFAILLAHIFFNMAVVVRAVGGLWSHLDPRQEEAARMLGATRRRAFTSVTLPLLRPALAAAASIVFLFSFTSFGVILILGGPTRATLETEIFRQTSELLDLRTAAALSIVQLVAVVVLLVVVGRLQGRRAIALGLRPSAEVARPPRTTGERAFVIGTLGLAVAFLGAPLAVLVARSFDTVGGVGLGFYRALGTVHAGSVLFVPPTDAIRNSLLYAVAATAIATVVGGAAAFAVARSRRGRALDAALALPLGVSAVTLGFGFLIALDKPPLDLRTSWVLVPIAHALIAIPVRGADRRAGAALDRPASTRGRRGARRAAATGVARSRPSRRHPGAARGSRVRVRDLARRVRCHRVHRAPRPPDAAGADLPLARPAGRAELRRRDGGEHDPHGAHRDGGAGDRARPRRRARDLLMLEVRGLTVRYGDRLALDGVDLDVADGEVVCVLGPSGSGKSTLLRSIAGLEVPSAGRVVRDGIDLAGVPPHQRDLGLMFQDHALFPHRDVLGNVAFGPRMHGADRAAAEERARTVLELVGLTSFEHRDVSRLSGGEQQRVALARTSIGRRTPPPDAGRATGRARSRAA